MLDAGYGVLRVGEMSPLLPKEVGGEEVPVAVGPGLVGLNGTE